MEIVALDPGAVGRPGHVRVGGDNPAHRRRHAMAREKLDHTMAVGVANGRRRVDDDRARLLHRRQAIQDRPALAHDEHVRPRCFNHGVCGNQFDIESPLRQSLADASHDRGVVIDPPRRVGGLAQDAHAGHGRIHARGALKPAAEPSQLSGFDVVRPIDVEHQRQDDAIDWATLVDQAFEIVAQTVEAPVRVRDPMRRKPVQSGRDMAALIAAEPKNAAILVQSCP